MRRLALCLAFVGCATVPDSGRPISTLEVTSWSWYATGIEMVCEESGRLLVRMRGLDKGAMRRRQRMDVGTCRTAIPYVYMRGVRGRRVPMPEHFIHVREGMTLCVVIAEYLAQSTVRDCTART